MKNRMNRHTLCCLLYSLVFLIPCSSPLFSDTVEGKQVVSEFANQIRSNNLNKSKQYVIPKDRNLLFLRNNRIYIRLFARDFPLRKLAVAGDCDDRYSYQDQDQMVLYYPLKRRGRRFYIRYFLKNVSNGWKIRLQHSCIRSIASRFLSPLWTRSSDTDKWSYSKQIGYSQLTEGIPSGNDMLTSSRDGTIRRWDKGEPSSPTVVTDLPKPVYEMRVSPDRSTLMYRTDMTVHLRNLDQGEQIFQIQSMFEDHIDQRQHYLNGDVHDVTSVDVNWSRGLLMVGYQTASDHRGSESPFPKGIVEVWDIRSGEQVQSLEFDQAVVDVSMSRGGQAAGVITNRKIYYGKRKESFELEPLDINLRPDELLITSNPRSIYLLDGSKLSRYYPGSDSMRSLEIHGIDDKTHNVHMERNKDSDTLAVFQYFDEQIHLVNGKLMEIASSIREKKASVQSVRFINASRLLIGTTTGVSIADLNENTVNKRINGFRKEASRIEMFHESSNILVQTNHSTNGNTSSVFEVINFETGNVSVRKELPNRSYGIDVSPDDSLLATITGTKAKSNQGKMKKMQVLVKDTESLTTVLTRTFQGTLSPPTFTQNGHILIGKGGEHVELIDPDQNELIRTFDVPQKFRNDDLWLQKVNVSPDGEFVVGAIGKRTGLNQGKSHLLAWDRRSGKLLRTSDRINGLVMVMEFTGSSKRVLAAGKINAYLTMYDVPGLQLLKKPFNIRLQELQHIEEQKYLFNAGDGPKANHVLDLETRQIWTLPGVSGGPAQTIDMNRKKSRVIGSFDTGQLILWKRR